MATGMPFWAFEHYLINSPHKQPLTRQDITAMADLFYSFNTTIVGVARPVVDGNFTDCDWPDFGAVGDASGVDAVRDTATIDQAMYPESHRSGG